MSRPLVSALIVSRGRPDHLRRCIRSAVAQDWPELECLVLANGCAETAALVRKEFPEVRLHETAENVGAGPGRNRLVEAARGEYLLCLDDDGELRDPEGVARLVAAVGADPRIAVVSMSLLNAASDEPTGWRRSLGDVPFPCLHASFGGGACLVRRSAFLDTGGYPDAIPVYGEEFDLTVRLYDRGFAVVHLPDVEFHHQVEGIEHAWQGKISAGYGHLQYTICRLYPGGWAALASLKALLSTAWVTGRLFGWRHVPGVVGNALRWAAKGRRERAPVAVRGLERLYFAKYFRVDRPEDLAAAPRGLLARLPLYRLLRKVRGIPKLTFRTPART
jgi:GT2 family glycosyltransferase